jgi:hypothetical protein
MQGVLCIFGAASDMHDIALVNVEGHLPLPLPSKICLILANTFHGLKH